MTRRRYSACRRVRPLPVDPEAASPRRSMIPPAPDVFDPAFPNRIKAASPPVAHAEQDRAERRLAYEKFGAVTIETFWLGANHGASERAAHFETVIKEHGVVLERHPYDTILAACEGHDRLSAAVQRRVRTAAWRESRRAAYPSHPTDTHSMRSLKG